MRIDPPIKDAAKYPITSLLMLAATCVSLLWWSGTDIAWALPGGTGIMREPWRLVLTVLPHINLIHLLFNVLWTWEMGTRIEQRFGAARFVGLVVVLAIVSGAAEIATGIAGVGLSGVVYGFFGLMYAMRSRDEMFAKVLSQQTIQLFIIWFFVCIVLTVIDVMPVGNVAHGVGSLVGWLTGRACISAGMRRQQWSVAVIALAVVAVAGAATTPFGSLRLFNNSHQLAYEGHQALVRGDHATAIEKLEEADRDGGADAATLVNLGIAYQHADRHDDALPLYRRAIALDHGLLPSLAESMAVILDHQAHDALQSGQHENAEAALEEAATLNANDHYAWAMLGQVRWQRGELKGALQAYRRALALEPDDDATKKSIKELEQQSAPPK